MPLLGTAVLILWIGLILGAKQAVVLWQGIPEPPQEAFSDTGGRLSLSSWGGSQPWFCPAGPIFFSTGVI